MGETLDRRPDAGFTIIELLIAVAIASLVVIAIGGLFAVGIRVHDRTAENAAVQSALIELQTLASLAASEVELVLATPSETGFGLEATKAGRAGVVNWKVRLESDLSQPRIELRHASNVSSVDLSAFDTAVIEYLVVGSQAPSWVKGGNVSGAEVQAARLRLSLGQRVWRPLIWIYSASSFSAL